MAVSAFLNAVPPEEVSPGVVLETALLVAAAGSGAGQKVTVTRRKCGSSMGADSSGESPGERVGPVAPSVEPQNVFFIDAHRILLGELWHSLLHCCL